MKSKIRARIPPLVRCPRSVAFPFPGGGVESGPEIGSEGSARSSALSSSPSVRHVRPAFALRGSALLLCLSAQLGGTVGIVAQNPAAGAGRPQDRARELVREVLPQLADFDVSAPSELVHGEIDLESGDLSRTFSGNVARQFTVEGLEVRVRCDHLVIEARGVLKLRKKKVDGDGATGEDVRPDFWCFADGNVLIEIPAKGTAFEAESFYYDHVVPVAILRGVRARTTISGVRDIIGAVQLGNLRREPLSRRLRADPKVPVIFTADSLRTSDFRSFSGDVLRVTTCDYSAAPHVALRLEGATVATVDTDDAAFDLDEVPADPLSTDSSGPAISHLSADFAAAHLELWGSKILPLGLRHWDTRWHDFLPIRRVDFGSSSKFGPHSGVDWNVNFFLRRLGLEEAPVVGPLVERSKIGFETLYMGDRGFGWGPFGEYGRRPRRWAPWQLRPDDGSEPGAWEYHGEGRYFALQDHGEDRFAGAGAPEDPDRYWGSIVHRQALPWLGTVDIEYSTLSDPTVLGEYFESIAKQEKEQESLALLRRNFTDNKAVTALVKYRTNDFDSTVERLPEGRFWMYQEPLFDSGLYTDLVAQAANLHVRPADGSGLSSTRYARADVYNELAYPMSFLEPWVQLRPYTMARFTAYEEVADPASGSENRFAAGAGIVASQQWSRLFRTDPEGRLRRWLDLDSVAHVIVPSVSYENVFTNNLDSTEVIAVDDVDTPDLREAVSISLSQGFITRYRLTPAGASPRTVRPRMGLRDVDLTLSDYQSWRFLDSDIRFVVFPRPGRDNGGDALSLLVLDNTLRVTPHFAIRSWVGLDPNDHLRGSLVHNSVRAEVLPDLAAVTVGEIYSNALPGATDTNRAFALLSLYPRERWRAQLYWQFDLDRGEDAEIGMTIGRVFHRFALLFEYSFDAGEDDNHSFSINFRPLDFLGGSTFERGSRW